jgi:hypothetical protein
VAGALPTQGQAWHALLAGRTDISGQTSVDAWVEASESILRSIRVLTLRILERFWPVVVIILAVTGGLLFLVGANAQGTSKVWVIVVTVAGAFGLSGASLRAAAKKSVSGIEEDFVAAWSWTRRPGASRGSRRCSQPQSSGVSCAVAGSPLRRSRGARRSRVQP